MSDYIVSARKYRPESFGTLLGQNNIATTLCNSIVRGKLAHAYLFCGPRGVGKTTSARIFAKMINCSNPGEGMEPCGECESCRSFAEGRSYCIHELDAASNNSVEDIKKLMDQVRVAPQVGKYNVFIIDEVHMLSSQAFNAFLKTLEEPPAHAVFILATTEKHKILPTILSRCQTYDFNRISIEDMVRNLRNISSKEGITIDDESLHLIAQKADGAMRDALTIFDQTVAFCGSDVRYEDVVRNLNVLDYEHSFSIVDNFLNADYASALLKLDELLAKGFNALYFVSAISLHLRNLIVSKSNSLDSLLELPASLKQRYAEQASRCSVKFLFDALALTTQCESAYKASVNPRLHIEFTLMRLSFLMKAPQPQIPTQVPTQIPAQTPSQPQTQPQAAVRAQVAAPAPSPVRTQTPPPTTVQKAEPVQVQPQTPVQPKVQEEAKAQAQAPVQVQTPAQSVEKSEVKSEKAAPVRRQRRTSGLVPSISNLKDSDSDASSSAAAARTSAPDQDEVRDSWMRCARSYEQEKPRLCTMLQSSTLRIETKDDNVTVVLSGLNQRQDDWFKATELPNIEQKLRDILEWSGLKIVTEVSEDAVIEVKPYSPEEKYRQMQEENPHIGTLVENLGASLN